MPEQADISVGEKISATTTEHPLRQICFTEEKFQNRPPNVRQLRENVKEVIHPMAIWQPAKKCIEFHHLNIFEQVCF